jgi:S1-C subfamily serine protease
MHGLRSSRIPLLACGLLLAWQPLVHAQDIDALERKLQDVARDAIPRTVLVRVFTENGQQGAGSGAIISPDGFILTCSHVIEIGARIEVARPDGTTYPARVVGKNRRQDYALIKVEAKDLPVFTIGDSDTVKAGDWVMALGHPGGPYADLQPAFAAGKVRSLHRKLPVGFMEKFYNDAIMTDVPIFAGDSGGPLVNMKGELVGINGAIVMINEMAFAVPTNQIMKELDALKQGQNIEGVPAGPDAFKDMQDIVSPEDYQKLMSRAFKNLPKMLGGEDGPLGRLFGEDSPLKDMFGGGGGEMPDLSKLFGEDSPFKDLFGGGNGREMPGLGELFGDPEKLQEMMDQLFGGDSPFGGESPFGGRPRERQPAAPEAPAKPQGKMGVSAAEQRPDLPGVLVDQVVPGGPAELGGLKRGDVILSVDGRPTKNAEGLKAALQGKGPGTRVQVVVQRASFVDATLVQENVTLNVTLGR